MRKYACKKRRLSAESDSTPPTSSGNPQEPKRPKKCDFWNVVPTCDGITDSIHNEHVAELNKECQKPATKQDKTKIRQLMNLTYELRRKSILTTTVPVGEIIEKYPPLATINGVRYSRLHEEQEHIIEHKIIEQHWSVSQLRTS